MPELAKVRHDLRSVALGIRRWAIENNLLKRGVAIEPEEVDTPLFSRAARAMSVAARTVLESQAITAIGINAPQKTIFIYTTKKVAARNRKALPQTMDGDFRIEYRRARPVTIDQPDTEGFMRPEPYALVGSRYSCGSSISPGNQRMAGTLGALVRNKSGVLFGLTNNHVTGGCNNSRHGLPVLAPGIMDVMVGARDPFTIGWHESILTMRQGEPGTVDHKSNSDAALIKIENESLVTSMQGAHYDTPSRCLPPEEEMFVEKVGRTTGLRKGKIESEVVGPFPVNYKSVTYHSPDDATTFVGTVYFEPVYLIRGDHAPFSLPGDSGSLVTALVDGQRASVGLIFAGIEPDESYALPLGPILKEFEVTLVSGLGNK